LQVGAAPDREGRQREARERHRRAFELYDEGAYDAALSELKRAYELAPAFRILFNLGVMCLAVHDHARAINYFEQYLAEAGSAATAEVRAQVAQTLEELALRVARVSVRVNVPGALVYVDDEPAGTAPLGSALRLNAGRRRVSAHARGWLPDSRVLDVAGGDELAVELLLEPSHPSGMPVVAEPAGPRVPWMSWGATVLLAGGSVFCGLEALAAQNDLERKRRSLGVAPAELESADRAVLRWSLAADVLGVGALAGFGYSLYMTLQPEAPEAPKTLGSSVGVELRTNGVSVHGRF
jgi:tetratricopeptide (TPR) repeat protein